MLSGDKHFYARYAPEGRPAATWESVKIASGGGGAYLSGTQDLKPKIEMRERRGSDTYAEYVLNPAWPDTATARGRIARTALVRVWRHWSFSLVVALLYLLLAAIVRIAAADGVDTAAAVRTIGREPWPDQLDVLARSAAGSVVFWVFCAALGATLVGVALSWPSGARVMQLRAHWPWGIAHAAVHVALGITLTATALWSGYRLADGAGWGVAVYYGIVFVGGYVLGTLVYALYLVVAQRRGRSVWALSAVVAHEGWKNFLRMKLTGSDITVYALGVERVPRRRTVSWDRDGWLQRDGVEPEVALVDQVTIPWGEAPP
jgi:hypothetical protein